MRKWIGGFLLFAAGTVGGMLAQEARGPAVRLNHVGIYVKDFDESMRFYTKTMGFREAFTIRDKDNKPTLAYLQVTRDTFIELGQAAPERPVGLSHIGLWPEDMNATIAMLRSRGVQVGDPRTGSTKTSITNAVDPNGVRLEILDFLPDSLPRKAMESWK